MVALGWNDMNNGQETVSLFVMVTLNLRTASPPEAGRSLRGHEREACLLGEEQKRMTRMDEGAGLSGVTRYAVRSSITLG